MRGLSWLASSGAAKFMARVAFLPSSARPAALAALVVGACAIAATAVACAEAPPAPDELPVVDPVVTADAAPPKDSGYVPPVEPDSGPASDADAAPACVTAPPNNRCGLVPQCGCGPSETCDVTNLATGATSCITGGSATLGRPCNQTGDCYSGLTCLYGACRPYCATEKTLCTGSGVGVCISAPDSQDKPVPNRNVCTLACDPMNPSAVCGQNTCLWFATLYAPNLVSDCNVPGTVALLAQCDPAAYECKAGLACAKHPVYGNECEKWCRLPAASHASDCAAGYTCKDVFGATAPVIGGVKEGVCQD